ncbi:general substrate transporter [Martensiomyces pterosporus]|nr:general substrate transporter [Martensiomyces pterosporus]
MAVGFAKPCNGNNAKTKYIDTPVPRVFAVSVHDVDSGKFQDSRNAGLSWYVLITVVLASLSAVNIGWIFGVANISKTSICQFDPISDTQHSDFPSLIVFTEHSWAIAMVAMSVGGFLGALVSGIISDNIGRRNTIVINNGFFIAGAVLLGTATTSVHFTLGRFVFGVGCGVASSAVCTYIGEIAPIRWRGFFGAFFQLSVVIGILTSQVAAMFLSSNLQWRILVSLPGFVSILQIALLPLRVESPSYLIKAHHVNEARHALLKLRRGHDVTSEWQDCLANATMLPENMPGSRARIASIWQIMRGSTRDDLRHLFTCCTVLMALQQLSGIHGIIFCSSSLPLKLFDQTTALSTKWACIGVSASATPAVFLCMSWVDKLGRRPMLLGGFGGMIICSTLISIGMFFGPSTMVTAAVFLYHFLYNMSIGTVPWFYMAECVPRYALSSTIVFACSVNWGLSVVLTLLVPFIESHLSQYPFAAFGGFSLAGLLFVMLCVPETTGKPALDVVRAHSGTPHVADKHTENKPQAR